MYFLGDKFSSLEQEGGDLIEAFVEKSFDWKA